jgi:1-deoxy-D-xylulose-5-phosphate synthase
MAPASADELRRMVGFACAYDEGPIAFRYPRGDAFLGALSDEAVKLGEGRILQQGSDVAILSLGGRLDTCLAAARQLNSQGIAATVADARFCKPLDVRLIEQLARHHAMFVTVEEGAIGGFSSHVLQHLAHRDLLGRTRFRGLTLPDTFIAHGTPQEQLADAGLDAAGIAAAISQALGRPRREGHGHALQAVAAQQVL